MCDSEEFHGHSGASFHRRMYDGAVFLCVVVFARKIPGPGKCQKCLRAQQKMPDRARIEVAIFQPVGQYPRKKESQGSAAALAAPTTVENVQLIN